MRRRLLIPMMCLSLASMAPAPISACTMLMTDPVECAPAPAAPAPSTLHCDPAASTEGTDQDNVQAAATKLPCCTLAAAPVPDQSAGIGKVNVAPVSVSLENGPVAIPGQVLDRTNSQTELEQFAPPPDRQPFLCTFLI